MITETDKAYLAGLVDGEGCISILSNMQKGVLKHVLRVIISSTDKAVLVYFRDLCEIGFVTAHKLNPELADTHRVAYAWGLCSKQAATLLKMIYPYLHMKRDQADIALKFQDTMRTHKEVGSNGRGVKGNRTPPDLIYRRERYKQTLSNMKGYKTKTRGRPKQLIVVD